MDLLSVRWWEAFVSIYCDEGTVFLLNLLDQENKFNDLRWFLKAEEHFTSKFAKVNDATPSSVMPKNTISKFMQEFGYLNSTFSSSRMLFY